MTDRERAVLVGMRLLRNRYVRVPWHAPQDGKHAVVDTGQAAAIAGCFAAQFGHQRAPGGLMPVRGLRDISLRDGAQQPGHPRRQRASRDPGNGRFAPHPRSLGSGALASRQRIRG